MGAYTELVDFTVASATASVTFDLSATPMVKGEFYKVIFTGKTSTSVEGGMFVEINTLTSDSNYNGQFIDVQNTNVGAGRRQNRQMGNVGGETTHQIFYFIVSENNFGNMFLSQNALANSTSPTVHFRYQSTATTITSITQLRFFTDLLFGVGARFQIYRLDAEKVADITVTSNTTQVDISNLSIDKDSEYLLVSDILTGANASTYSITPNDLTTLSGYHSQRIRGVGSTALATRFNSPTFLSTNQNVRTMSHTHIKLSNISAYTAQSYNIDQVGTSDVLLQNFFISSTAENITSITKLNIISGSANNIATGSRFTLYKLYE